MSTFRGRAPSGLISRETGNYAWISEKDLWKTNLSFTGQKCHLNYIAIRPAGEISQACLGVNAHSNIFEDMDFGKNYRIPDVHCWVGYCGANCCTELIKVDEEEDDENG